jgi:putative endonuclease
MKKYSFIYILTNERNSVLYTGVTTNLIGRIWQHKEKLAEGFTKRYNLNKLVYYEVFEDIIKAIEREKQIKKFLRAKKINLINAFNPAWRDLYEDL